MGKVTKSILSLVDTCTLAKNVFQTSFILWGAVAVCLLFFVAGCTSTSQMQDYRQDAVPTVQGDYRVIKYNAVGESAGFKLLGIIQFKTATYPKAMADLWEKSGVEEGTATALVNVTEDISSTYFILFSIPKVTIRAEIIEYKDIERPQPRPIERVKSEPLPPPPLVK